jgi:hypothetical protein
MDMSTGTGSGTDPQAVPPPPPADRVVSEGSYRPRTGMMTSPTLVGENVLPVRNRIQWGPIAGGVVTALATFLLLTVLGIALGASVLEPRNTGEEIGRWAAIWGAFSVIAAFLAGGWMASRTAAVEGSFAAIVNGLITGAAGLLLVIWLSFNGLGALFGTLGAGVGTIANAAQITPQDIETATGVPVSDTDTAAEQAGAAVDQATEQAGEALARANTPETFEAVRNGAIGTFLGLLLPLVAATLGGWAGKHTRQDLVTGTGS